MKPSKNVYDESLMENDLVVKIINILYKRLIVSHYLLDFHGSPAPVDRSETRAVELPSGPSGGISDSLESMLDSVQS